MSKTSQNKTKCTLKNIHDFLGNYEDIWNDLDMGDVSCDVVDETDYYGCDMSKKQRMIMLFFNGQSDCFFGMHIGNVNEKTCENLDEYPIYYVDLSSDDAPILEGNFRQFIEKTVGDNLNDDLSDDVNEMLEGLKVFSNDLIKHKPYQLKINE